MDDGILDIEFDEVGVLIDGADVGMFEGSASINRDGYVTGLYLNAYVTDKAAHTLPKKVTRYLDVPKKRLAAMAFNERLAYEIAASLEINYRHVIDDQLNDYFVSRLEREWEPDPTLADAFEAIRSDLRDICDGAP